MMDPIFFQLSGKEEGAAGGKDDASAAPPAPQESKEMTVSNLEISLSPHNIHEK